MPKQLKGLKVHEVSGVDAAANRRTFLIAKGATNMADQTNIIDHLRKGLAGLFGIDPAPTLDASLADQYDDKRVNDLCCALSDAIDAVLDSEGEADKRTAVIGLMQQFLERLDGEGFLKAAALSKAGRKISAANMASLQSIKATLDKLLADSAADPADKAAPNTKPPAPPEGDDPNPDDEEEEDPMEKSADLVALEKRATDAEAAIAKANTEITNLTEQLAKERGQREDAEHLAKAKAIGAVPGQSFEQTAALLKSVAGNTDLAAQTEAMLKASAEAARTSALFTEVGKSGAGSNNAGTPAGDFTRAAEDLAKSANLPLADAMTRVAKEQPDLYTAYTNNQRKGA